MKTFSVAVLVAVVVVVVCVDLSSAVPLTEVEGQEEVMVESPAAEQEQMSMNIWEMPYSRQKRGITCRFCCGCCKPGVCGVCCRF